jgi:hypothetical protein
MKKKIVLIAAALFIFASVEAFSFGIGLRGNIGWDSIYGGGLLFSPDDKKHFGLNYYMGEDSFHLGVTGDLWLLNQTLTNVGSGELNFYAGPGIYAQLGMPKDGKPGFGIGLRVPVGVDLDFDIFDVFLEIAPQIGLSFLPNLGLYGNWFNAAIGFRFWLG